MARPASIHDRHLRQTARTSTRELPPLHPGRNTTPSSDSNAGPDGCPRCQQDAKMSNRAQEVRLSTLLPPRQPSEPRMPALHRRPRLSSLYRRRESADETTWTIDHTSAAADLRHGVPRSVEAVSSRMARLSTSSHPAPHRWSHSRSSAYTAHCFEWETETLFEQQGIGSLPNDAVSYPCPFRKRNPARFNFRDHESCARGPFSSVLDLIDHIRDRHRRQPVRHQCRRCKQGFDSEAELERHLVLPREQMCEVKSLSFHDPEDGITDEIETAMVRAIYTSEEGWSWDTIWHCVFPDDPKVPEPDFPPFVELVDIEQAFDQGQQTLKATLREKLQLLLPDATGDDYLSFLTGQLELVFDIHRVNVVKQLMGRSSATLTREGPPSTHTVQQQSTARKPNRPSRRSTLLQALRRNPNASETAEGPPSRRHSRTGSVARNRHLSNEQPPHRTAGPHTRFPTTPTFPSTCLASDDPPSPHDDMDRAKASKPNPNPRDSRDSGISMPCEACEEPDVCRCDGGIASDKSDAAEVGSGDEDDSSPRYHLYYHHRHHHSQHGHQHQHHGEHELQHDARLGQQATEPSTDSLTNPSPASNVSYYTAYTSPTTSATKTTPTAIANPPKPTPTTGNHTQPVKDMSIHLSRPQRPRLSLDTTSLLPPTNTLPPRASPDHHHWHFEVSAGAMMSAAGGRFSPESFKQRVLRGRLGGG
ncbi:hypothetical protein N658DRAFT_526620 [Parathielavia hyrcaniae]|uniref:C2H2-type domain-containing protein n=1 Tax=Parathielavia hyrcaniae TaxID=113614 RepID=A0AAN6PYX1_9PEZI|nr:hypothetical protein N658DRAFT_526620 [Parathielavia hyrcaniae]